MVIVVKGLTVGAVLLVAVTVFKLQVHIPTFYTLLGAELAASFAGGLAKGVKNGIEKSKKAE